MVLVLTVLLSWAQAEPITLEGLLEEMVDRSRIAEFPEPEFTCLQVSSYDRLSKTPGNAEWFANDDWSHFYGVEDVDGRREWVMMDEKGPGVVVRWWITGFKFGGVIRVYLDGASEPVFQGKADELIGGDVLLGGPLSAERSRGRNLYLPIPYQKSIKITYDGPHEKETKDFSDNLYYNINYRQYPKGTDVKTFTMAEFKANATKIEKVQKQLLEGNKHPLKVARTVEGSKGVLKPGQSMSRSVTGLGAICLLKAKIEAKNIGQAMRSTVISAEFDGQRTVWVPIGEFFGTGLGLNAYKGWWRQVDKDGWMSCYWPMPFKKNATVTVTNHGSDEVTVEIADIGVSDWKWIDRTMYFHSSWRGENEIAVFGPDQHKIEDWNYVKINGKGVYVGDTLAVFNRANAAGNKWWGEGDEKIFVDGEKFPSHFGTGSEDYFGYAWCWHGYFTAPFHAQPNGAGNNSVNHTTNTRVRSLDSIPFNKSFQFDMELWHWQATLLDYAATTYWYTFDGATNNGEISPEKVAEKIGKVHLFVEGETAQLRKVTGGFTEAQSGNWSSSGDKHLWWTRGQVGDELAIAIQVAQTGEYEVVAQMITAADYGRFRIVLDGQELSAAEDFYVPQGVHVKRLEVGRRHLEKGEHILSFTILEKNSSAKPGNYLGIDCLKLTNVD